MGIRKPVAREAINHRQKERKKNWYIMELALIRNLSKAQGKLVRGILILLNDEIVQCKTLENLLYLAPEGKYLLVNEFSPKFNRKLWELYGISGRTEIKFHLGFKPEHSRGCILLGGDSLDMLHSTLDSGKNYIINIRNY